MNLGCWRSFGICVFPVLPRLCLFDLNKLAVLHWTTLSFSSSSFPKTRTAYGSTLRPSTQTGGHCPDQGTLGS
jgi:hypothetical protein